MNQKGSLFKDILNVTVSNVISLISSIFNGFIIPIILGTLNYGYYKIFILYASYTTLFHFGFNDGIMSAYGGDSYNTLNKCDFRANSYFFIIFEFIISGILICMSLIATNNFYKILFILLGVNSFVQNLLGYYQKISQAVMRFTEYSIVNTMQYVAIIIFILGIGFYCKLNNIQHLSYMPCVLLVIFINAALVIFYLYDYRDITFGKHSPLLKRIKSFKKYFISGFYMTFGYGISILIFNLDSQFVIKFFSTKTYGIYAFAYSMFSAGLTILGSAAVVILPHLKRHSKSYILSKYPQNIAYINLLVYLAIGGYFILKIIIHVFIFEYYSSLIYFRLLLPGMVITCCVSIVICNYYYALKKGKFYFLLSLIVLFISFVMDSIAYLLFKSPIALAFSSTMSLLVWYVLSDYFIVRRYHIKYLKNIIYIIIMMVDFWLFSGFNELWIGLICYLVSYLIISYLFFRHILYKLFNKLI